MTVQTTSSRVVVAVLCGLLCSSGIVACGSGDDGEELGVLRTQSGPFDGEITLDSDSPAVGDHEADLTLVDGAGDPLEGAEVQVTPFMPAHGHGSNEVDATESKSGRYVAKALSLFMPGVWELRVHVVQGDAEGQLVATYEVH
jgi:hypothetical protein